MEMRYGRGINEERVFPLREFWREGWLMVHLKSGGLLGFFLCCGRRSNVLCGAREIPVLLIDVHVRVILPGGARSDWLRGEGNPG